MASSEEVVPLLPDTLPENFSEWDSEASPAPGPAGSDEWESVSNQSKPPRPIAHGEPENLDEILSSVADRSRVRRPDSHAPVIARPQGDYAGLEKDRPPAPQPFFARSHKPAAASTSDTSIRDTPSPASPQPEAQHTPNAASAAPSSPNAPLANEARTSFAVTDSISREADKALFEIFSAQSSEDEEEPKTWKNKKLMVVGGVAAAILIPLIPVLLLGHHGTKAAVNPSVQPVSAATDTEPEASTPDQSVSQPLPQDKPAAAVKSQQTVESQKPQAGTKTAPSPAVDESQIEMMKGQLTAPRMISEDVKKQTAENAPPPENIGMAGMDALAGSRQAANAFTSSAKPVVKSLKPVAISSGVATGMLIQ
jgi:hypothetical protein